ncbi:MAG: hypothetical protein WC854_02200 [Bacteroidales bacterium]
MKKGLSISLVLLMLTAMLHFTVATHYCSGKVLASKVSLSGKLASCGMECSEKDYHLPESHLISHCCDDVVNNYAIDNYYTPSFSVVPDSYQNKFQIFSVPGGLFVLSSAVLKSLNTSISPPDELMSTSVDLSGICVFRI